MKIKVSSQHTEDVKLNQQNPSVVKTGDTKFEEGLKELNKMQPQTIVAEENQAVKVPVETLKVDNTLNLNETHYVYVAQNLPTKKNDKIVDKNLQNLSENEKPQMILDELVPQLVKKDKETPIADVEEFISKTEFKSEKPQVQELQQTIETLSNLPKPDKVAEKINLIDKSVDKVFETKAEIETVVSELKPKKTEKLNVESFKPEISDFVGSIQAQLKPQIPQTDKVQEFVKPQIAEIIQNELKPQIPQTDKVQEFVKPQIAETIQNELKPQVPQMDKVQEFVKPQIAETIQNELNPQMPQTDKLQGLIKPQSPQKIQPSINLNVSKIETPTINNVQKNESEITVKNDMLAQLLNEKVDLTHKIPTMEQIIPEQLRPTAKKDAFSKDKFIKTSTGKIEESTPINNLKSFLSEALSPETIKELQTKDIAIQDDNVLLTEEIKNYYNLNNAKAAAAMDDIKTMLDERVSVLSDISKIISSNNEVKEIKKELSSIETKKHEKVETKALKVTEKDATFFNNLIKEANVTEQVANDTTKTIMEDVKKVQENAKQATVSKALADMIAESSKTNKPFRIDFDKDISVIIKVDKDGKISADFIPGDKAVEQYLRNSMPLLKQKFAEEQIDYKELNYKQSRNQNKERRNKGNKGE